MRSNSTQQIIRAQASWLEKKEDMPANPQLDQTAAILCPVHIPADLKNQLQRWGLSFPDDEKFSLEKLREKFNDLCQLEEKTQENQRKLAIKEYKLCILESYLKLLRGEQQVSEKSVEKESLWKRVRYGFLLFAGILSEGIGSFLGSADIASVIPSISDFGILVISVSFSIINAFLFYAFESNAIREAMGLDTREGTGLHLAADEEEIELTIEINQEVNNRAINKLSRPQYAAHAKFIDTLNTAVMNKKQFQHSEMQEKLPLKVLRYLITGLGALMMSFNGFFMVKALLLSLAPSLLLTPAGPILMALGIGVMLTYFLEVRCKSVMGFLNPGIQKFKEVKDKYDKFVPQSELSLRAQHDEYHAKNSFQQLHSENEELTRENSALKQRLQEHQPPFERLLVNTKKTSASASTPNLHTLAMWESPSSKLNPAEEPSLGSRQPTFRY